jgi:hypothetical protein
MIINAWREGYMIKTSSKTKSEKNQSLENPQQKYQTIQVKIGRKKRSRRSKKKAQIGLEKQTKDS